MGTPREPHTSSNFHWSAPKPEPPELLESPVGEHESVQSLPPLGHAPRHSAQMRSHMTTSTRSSRRRLTWLISASISVIGISALLAACFFWTLLPSLQAFVGSQLSPTQGQAASGPAGGHTSTATAGHTTAEATATALPPSDWRSEVHAGANYRFQIDMPAMLTCSHGFFINNFSGQGCDYTYSGVPAQTALQHVELETQVELLSSTEITDRNICPQGGTQVRVGTGANTLTGWERDDVSTTTSDGTVTLNLVVHGTPIQLSLEGFGGQPQPFFDRYGPIWHHMLASFTLLPSPVTQSVHPCG